MRRNTIILILAISILCLLTMACNDWDGMDRSGWQPTPTMEQHTVEREPRALMWTPEVGQ